MKKPRLAKKFLDELSELPIVSIVCKRLNLSRQTVYRWLKEDLEFAKRFEEALHNGRDGITDLAESKLIRNIDKGEQRAMIRTMRNQY